MNLSRLWEFFSDGQYLSATRLLFVSWGLSVLLVWLFLNIYSALVLHTVVMVGIHPMVLAWLGTLIGGKVVQNITENAATKISESKIEVTSPDPKPVVPATPEAPKV